MPGSTGVTGGTSSSHVLVILGLPVSFVGNLARNLVNLVPLLTFPSPRQF
jgi:hypothetical protein